MMHFRQTVLIQIKSALNETELEDVVSDSIQRLKIKNVHGHIIQRFISGMEQTLDRERTDQLSTKALKNMDRARDLFRKLLKP